MIVPFEMAGGTGGHKSKQFSSELTRNMYSSYSESNRKWGCHDFHGLKLRSSGTGPDRGDHEMGGVRFVINGSTLYKEDSNWSRTALGTVSGTDRAIFADDGTNLYFTANNAIWKWDGTTLGNVSQSVVTNPSAIDYINRQFIIAGDGGLFGVSDPGDGDTYNALNYAEEETLPDALLRPYVFIDAVYMAGSKGIVPWVNDGVGNPPFSRQENGLVNIGLAGKHAITNTDRYIYWISDDKKAYQAIGSSARQISTQGVSYHFDGFNVSDCIASSFTIEGQDFVLFKFPTNGAAFVYSEQNQYWFELSSGTSKTRESWYGNAISQAFGKNVVTDYRNGNTYELDSDTYTDNGDSRLRIRVLPTLTGAMIKKPGRRILVKGLGINMQNGTGLTTGQGSDPQLMCQFSHEGGEVWQVEKFVSMGSQGEYVKRVRFDDFASGYEIKARIMCSEPCYLSLFDGYVDVDDGGY